MSGGEKLSTEPYKGVRDFYPADWAREQALFATMRDTLGRWGYEEYQASPLERAELYEAKTSEEIVNEQTYTFTDRGDRRVTLRPEMTPTLARMVAAKRREIPFPARWYSIPNVFRYERPQRGRLREHYQLNVDLIGSSSEDADAEIVSIAYNILTAFGAKPDDFKIFLNDRRIMEDLLEKIVEVPSESTRAVIRQLDRIKKDEQGAAEKIQEEIGAEKTQKMIATLKGGADTFDTLDEVSASYGSLKKIIAKLQTLEPSLQIGIDPLLARGFDYYTGMVFEVFDTNPENTRSLFGGGRYDGLVGLYGGEPIPAVGFGMGDVTLADFIETHGLTLNTAGGRPELYIGTPSADDLSVAQQFAQTLRTKGVRVFVNLTGKSLGDQIKDAVRRNIPYFLAYGSHEQSETQLRLKTLADGTETAVEQTALAEHLIAQRA